MREKIIYDDFTGFTFNGKHSSQFGLLRVSDGDRYEDDLVLSLSDESAEVPGGVGEYYWGETIKKREFNINVAYDSVTEMEKREIKQWLHPDDKLHELIFDEKPYVKYYVKCSNQIASKELCFNENGKRVYKGEFKIEFTAYMPYGVARWKTINESYITGAEPIPDIYGNLHEWFPSSGLRTNLNDYNFSNSTPNHFLSTKVYNPGDVPTDFTLKFSFQLDSNTLLHTATKDDGESGYTKVLTALEKLESTKQYAIFNPNLHRLQGENLEEVSLKDLKGNIVSDGYIENINNFPFYVDNNNGEKYEIYYYNNFSKAYRYNIDSFLNLTKYQKYYGLFYDGKQTKERPFYFDDSDFVWILDETGIDNKQYNFITLKLPHDIIFDIKLQRTIENGHPLVISFMRLRIPSGINIETKNWSNVQKALYENKEITIDSMKKTIYSGDEAVGDILDDGDFFKIPINNITNTDESFTIVIEEPSQFISNFSQASIRYDYLYI